MGSRSYLSHPLLPSRVHVLKKVEGNSPRTHTQELQKVDCSHLKLLALSIAKCNVFLCLSILYTEFCMQVLSIISVVQIFPPYFGLLFIILQWYSQRKYCTMLHIVCYEYFYLLWLWGISKTVFLNQDYVDILLRFPLSILQLWMLHLYLICRWFLYNENIDQDNFICKCQFCSSIYWKTSFLHWIHFANFPHEIDW